MVFGALVLCNSGQLAQISLAGLVPQVAALMASTLGVDMVMTGHSLGRNKLEHLLASGAP